MRERIVDATGLLEDGSAVGAQGQVQGRVLDSPEFQPLAQMYYARFTRARDVFVNQYSNNLVNGFRLLTGSTVNNLGVTGILLAVFGFMTFTFTLLLHSTAVAVRRGR